MTVVDEGHFGRAAAKLLITSPTLTQQIQRLERVVGFALLDRTGHPVVPTEPGAVFLREARSVLAAADRAWLIAQIEAQREGNQFRLGFVATPLGRFTRAMVDAFAEQAGPDVLSLVELSISDQTDAVASGWVEASLVWSPVVQPPHLRIDPGLTVPRVLVVSADHHLAGHASVTLAETNRETYTFVSNKLGDLWRQWWYVDPRPDGRPVRYGRQVDTVIELLEEVATGRAMTIAPAMLADAHPHRGVAFVEIADIEPSKVSLCTRANDTSPNTALMRRIFTRFSNTKRAPSASDARALADLSSGDHVDDAPQTQAEVPPPARRDCSTIGVSGPTRQTEVR